jgi:hypothetical protein
LRSTLNYADHNIAMSSVFKPPTPVTLAVISGGSGGGTSITNSSSSVSCISDASAGLSSVEIKTNYTTAISADVNQRVVIGNPSDVLAGDRLTLVDPLGSCLRLINSTTAAWSSVSVDADGYMSLGTSGLGIRLGSNNLHIGTGALHIGQSVVNSTAAQLNYVNISSPGTAVRLKALVVDNDYSISNINSLSAISVAGTLLTTDQPNINNLNSVNIATLSLGGSQVQSTAAEINYLRGCTPGTALAMRALVIDSTKSIAGIQSIIATSLSGTLQTAYQPLITTVGTLSSLSVGGFIGVGTTAPTRDIEIVSAAPTIRFSTGTSMVEIGIDFNGNYRLNPDNAIVVAANKNMIFSGTSVISGLAGIAASGITGTMLTPVQPNITSVGSLTDLTTFGDVTIGSFDTTSSITRLIVNEPQGMCLRLCRSALLTCSIAISAQGDTTISPTRDVRLSVGTALIMAGAVSGVTDLTANTISGLILTPSQPNITTIGTLSSLNVTGPIAGVTSLTADTLTGVLQTGSQPNITSVGTLSSLNVTGPITSGMSIAASTVTGILLTAAQPNITSTGILSQLTVSTNITALSVNVDTLTGTLTTGDQPNITSIGTLTRLSVINEITTSTVTASTLTGTILTTTQPNITSVGTLNALSVTGSITSSSITTSDISGTLATGAQPNITSVGTLSSLNVSSSITSNAISAPSLTGTIQTGLQPNITTVGTLSRLLTTGPIGIGVTVPTNAVDIDTTGLPTLPAIGLVDGTATASIKLTANGVIIDTNGQYLELGTNVGLRFRSGVITGLTSINVSQITGTLMTEDQPNLKTVGSLTYLQSDRIGVGIAQDDYFRLKLFDPNGKMITMSDGSNVLTMAVTNGNYTINTSNNNLALGPLVNLVLNGGTIIGLDTLVATAVNATNLGGIISDSYQPNITSVGTLSSLNVSGPIAATSATLGSAHITGGLSVDGPLTLTTPLTFGNLSSSTGAFTAGVAAVSYTDGGTLTVNGGAAFSANVFVGTSLTLGGTTITGSDVTPILGATPGIVTPGVFLITGPSKSLTGFETLSATTLSGALSTGYQPAITNVGTLLGLNVNGYAGIGTTSPMRQMEINSTTGDCLRLSYDNVNTPSMYMDMSVGSTGNATIAASGGKVTFGSVIAGPQMMLGSTSNNTMPLELGFTPFTMTAAYSYNTAANSHGTLNPASSGYISYNYSIRALGRILCTQSLDVTSDRRTKKNITSLTEDWCSSFIERTRPVSFNWIDGDQHKSFGYIAQELMQAGFSDLVNIMPDDSAKEEIDADGFISPEGAKFTVTYEHVIPILAMNQKRLMRENEELKTKLDTILIMLQNR